MRKRIGRIARDEIAFVHVGGDFAAVAVFSENGDSVFHDAEERGVLAGGGCVDVAFGRDGVVVIFSLRANEMRLRAANVFATSSPHLLTAMPPCQIKRSPLVLVRIPFEGIAVPVKRNPINSNPDRAHHRVRVLDGLSEVGVDADVEGGGVNADDGGVIEGLAVAVACVGCFLGCANEMRG